MNRSLNIPRTDMLVWNSIKKVVSDYNLLRKRATEDLRGRDDPKDDLRTETKKQNYLIKRLQKTEELLAQIESSHLLEDNDEAMYLQVEKT